MGNNGENLTFVDNFVKMLEKDSRGLEILTYGITGIGLLTALYRIRPFAKFSDPKKVPHHFIKSQTIFQGTVARIEPGKTVLLLVDHQPLINLPIPRFVEKKYLPVKITGVNVTNHGISWLSTIVQGNKIEFVPVQKTKDYLDCTVRLLQAKQEPLDVGKDLVALGFGTTSDFYFDPKNKHMNSYKNLLMNAEKLAKLKRNGQWHFMIHPTIWWRIKSTFNEKIGTFNTKMMRY